MTHPKEEIIEPESDLFCPRCYSYLVRRSRRRTIKDRWKGLLGERPYRCEECDLRFYAKTSSDNIPYG